MCCIFRPPFVHPVPNTFLSLRKNCTDLQEVITTTNDYILGEIGTGEQDMRENLNRHKSVLPRCKAGADTWYEFANFVTQTVALQRCFMSL